MCVKIFFSNITALYCSFMLSDLKNNLIISNVVVYLEKCEFILKTLSCFINDLPDPQPCPITLNYPIDSHSSLKSILYTDKLNWSSSIKITISYSRKCLAWVRRDLQKLHIGKEVWAPTQHYNLFLIATYIYFIPLYPSLSKSQ